MSEQAQDFKTVFLSVSFSWAHYPTKSSLSHHLLDLEAKNDQSTRKIMPPYKVRHAFKLKITVWWTAYFLLLGTRVRRVLTVMVVRKRRKDVVRVEAFFILIYTLLPLFLHEFFFFTAPVSFLVNNFSPSQAVDVYVCCYCRRFDLSFFFVSSVFTEVVV